MYLGGAMAPPPLWVDSIFSTVTVYCSRPNCAQMDKVASNFYRQQLQ